MEAWSPVIKSDIRSSKSFFVRPIRFEKKKYFFLPYTKENNKICETDPSWVFFKRKCVERNVYKNVSSVKNIIIVTTRVRKFGHKKVCFLTLQYIYALENSKICCKQHRKSTIVKCLIYRGIIEIWFYWKIIDKINNTKSR